jgi:hypothetical protein
LEKTKKETKGNNVYGELYGNLFSLSPDALLLFTTGNRVASAGTRLARRLLTLYYFTAGNRFVADTSSFRPHPLVA